MKYRACLFCLLLVVLSLPSFSAEQSRAVVESEREIPVAYDVDVLVVGGSSGAVAAAAAAAKTGASVFLAAPRTYLGEDLCGTYRLWLEPGEEPESDLAKTLFAEPEVPQVPGEGLAFTYSADLVANAIHPEKEPPSRMNDGRWQSATADSVQYDATVTMTFDLGEPKALRRVHVLAYQRNGGFETSGFTVAASTDGETWTDAGSAENPLLGMGGFEENALAMSADTPVTARYLRLVVNKPDHIERQLLAEVIVESADAPEVQKGDRIPPTPMQIKRILDQTLLDAGVQFLYGCYPTEYLAAELKAIPQPPAGIIMANRAGRQAVRAKVIIDATPRATVARMAGIRLSPRPGDTQTFTRVVVGGEPRDGAKLLGPVVGPQNAKGGGVFPAYEYTLEIPMPDASWASYAAAEQIARDRTFSSGQVAASEMLFQLSPHRLADPTENQYAADVPGGAKSFFRGGLIVFGPSAAPTEEAAAGLMRPLNYIAAGEEVGKYAGEIEEERHKPEAPVIVRDSSWWTWRPDLKASGEIGEFLGGLRPEQKPTDSIKSPKRELPVIAEYDVVIVGGGTGGAPAGIAAARKGAKTLVLEYQYGLGGVGTLGLISKYYHGYRGGFTAEIDKGVEELAGDHHPGPGGWDVESKMEWFRRTLREAGADVWFGVLGCGAVVDEGRVIGVVVATPEGRGAILADNVIDSTGNADIAVAAGADSIYTDGSSVAVQGTGLPPRHLGGNYTNTDYLMVDETDVIDMWSTYVSGRAKYDGAYDMGQLIDTRERRRIVGDFVISPLDILNGRTYEDSVGFSSSDFDTHGYTIHPVFSLRPPDRTEIKAYTPYRALLPKGLDGILVTGLGISAHRDAMPILRMQPDIQNQGYAAGTAAAMASAGGTTVRNIDIKALQKEMAALENIPESALTDTDPFPLPVEEVAAAVKAAAQDYTGIGIILAQPDDALPLLRAAYQASELDHEKLVYAHILGMLGDATGAQTLADAIAAQDWDAGWNFRGMGQFDASLSKLDSLIMAAGHAGDKRALQPILDKVAQLGPESEFSHHRAVAVALEQLGSREAAGPLAMLLSKEGMGGYAVQNIEDAQAAAAVTDPNLDRNLSLRELILARALYRCGDFGGLGEKTLEAYAQDYRGHHARHAKAVLGR